MRILRITVLLGSPLGGGQEAKDQGARHDFQTFWSVLMISSTTKHEDNIGRE